MIDLRNEIHDIIEETGHYVLLQRTSRKIRCVCWDEKYQEAKNDCPRCLGKGWVSRIERHKVRRQNASQIISLPDLLKQMPVGVVGADAKVFFFRHDTHPKKGDIIMEVGWRGNQPTHLIEVFEITSVDDLREQRGRIEFYQVVAKEKTLDTNIREITVRRMGPIRNYELIRG